jgi:folate-dependent phosphoribosylglycinamide formyltransferase PurN
MKIVILTNKGSRIGKKIINAFLLNRIEIAAVLVIKQPFYYYWKLFRSVKKRIGLLDTIFFSIRRIFPLKIEKRSSHEGGDFIEDYEKMGVPVIYTKGTNSKATLRYLKNLSPELLVLGQTGIVERELLEIPILGTLNAHPGILPYYRGIDCAKWAIFNGEFDKIGVTVHWVDRGIDTGNIITKAFYRLSGNEMFEKLSEGLYALCVETLIKVILLIESGTIPAGETQSLTEGSQYYKMPKSFERLTRKKLEDFLGLIKTSESQELIFKKESLDSTERSSDSVEKITCAE